MDILIATHIKKNIHIINMDNVALINPNRIITSTANLPMSMLMRVSFLSGIIQHYHGINFWTEDRFDYICLLVYQPQIKRTKVEFRQRSTTKKFNNQKIN